MRRTSWLSLTLVAGAAVAASSCVFRSTTVRGVDLAAPPAVVKSPAKAHLLDGSVIVFQHGFRLERDTLFGGGTRYDATLLHSELVTSVPLDEVVGVEAFHLSVNWPATVLGSGLATLGATVGGAALAVAIFGSCPTFYADSAGAAVLEAEAFSYSIAPLFEARDVDRLRFGPDRDGVLRLDVRNEAAETHYINQLALLDVAHDASETVVPDHRGIPLAVREISPPTRSTDRSGRDVHRALAIRDGMVFSSDSATLWNADADDPFDHIDLVFPPSGAQDSAALLLKVRNSLLSTVLLYDVMLAGQGAGALEWMGSELQQIGSALELGRWYVETMGLRVLVADGTGWRQVAWVRDVGPIAWKEIGVMLPATPDSMRVRLAFVTDGWRIDFAALAGDAHRPAAVEVPIARIVTAGGEAAGDPLTALRDPDERYLQTTPGQRFTAEFVPDPDAGPHTFLLVSQGYYVEWMRPDWLRQPDRGFHPSAASLSEALSRWRGMRADFERRFYTSRFPVR